MSKTNICDIGGCGGKIDMGSLELMLKNSFLTLSETEKTLIDLKSDCGVIKISGLNTLINVDFIKPFLNDPYLFGAIAVNNAMSDIFAMGGKVLAGMNILAYPENKYDNKYIASMLQGGLDKLHETGGMLLGGHTVKNESLFYGMAIIGERISNNEYLNHGLDDNDVIFVTKPIGASSLVFCQDYGLIEIARDIYDSSIQSLLGLNSTVVNLLVNLGISIKSITDISGFGLLGHLYEVCKNSNCSVEIQFDKVPIFWPEGIEIPQFSAGLRTKTYLNEGRLKCAKNYLDPRYNCLYESESSGGLIIGISSDDALLFKKVMIENNIDVFEIGRVFIDGDHSFINIV